MPWVPAIVKQEFVKFIYNTQAFHDHYGKEPNQFAFNAIADVCQEIATLLEEDEMPKNADVIMAGMLNVIETKFGEVVGLKKGRENFIKFIQDYNQTAYSRLSFSMAYKQYLKEYENKPKIKKGKEEVEISIQPASVNQLEILQSLERNKENQDKVNEDKVNEEHLSDIHMITKQELARTINSLRICPVRFYSGTAYLTQLWKRAWEYNPKAMAGSTLSLFTGLSVGFLATFEHFLGPLFDEFIKQTIKEPIDNEFFFAMGFIFAGVVVNGAVLIKNAPHYRNTDRLEIVGINNNGEVRKLDDSDSSDEENRLLPDEQNDRRRLRCC